MLGWIVAWTMPVLFRSLYRKVSRLLDLQPEDEVLDVACGSGVFLQKYASHVQRIGALDHSEIQIRMATQRNRDRIAAGTAQIVQGNSAALPWKGNSYSAVTCNCLGCFAEPQRSLQEMHRVLRPGGRVVILFEYIPDEEKARKYEQKWGLSIWNDAKARKMMDDAGFPQGSVSYEKTLKGGLLAKAIKQ